jgi:hypothetical protein
MIRLARHPRGPTLRATKGLAMNLRTGLMAVLAAALASGCASAPIIADLETDKAVIQQTLGNMETVQQEAAQACAIHHRKALGPLSQKCMDEYCFTKQYLFACTDSQ